MRAASAYAGASLFTGQGRPSADPALDAVRLKIDRLIAAIDERIARQLDAIRRHPRLRRLEASWRGLHYLVSAVDKLDGVKVRVLSVSWYELCRDLERAAEFDQSQLFQKVYEQEFGMPGGEPYGLLIGDYAISHRRTAEHPTDDVGALAAIAQVAAAAFAPFVAGAAPELFGLESFADLALPLDLRAIVSLPEYGRWRALRASEDARFLSLVLPQALVRDAYADDGNRAEPFRGSWTRERPDEGDFLWMNAAYAFAATVAGAYGRSGWFTDLRGARRGETGGGLVEGLPATSFATDAPGIAARAPLEVEIDPEQERALDELGLIPLTRTYAAPRAAFYSNASLQSPLRYDNAAARANARLAAMTQYILCVSRFAHFIKVLGRDRIGAFGSPEECQAMLEKWVMRYCTSDDEASPANLARYPLREAGIEVRERPGRPGAYLCTAHLKPHFQLDQIVSAFKLVTELAPVGTH